MSFRNVKDKRHKSFTGVRERHRGENIRQSRIRGAVGERGVIRNPRDRAVNHQPRRAAFGEDQAQFTDSGDGVKAPEFSIPTRNQLDPPLLEFLSKQLIDHIRMVQSGLPSRVTMLQRNDRGVRSRGRMHNRARRNRRCDPQRNTVTKELEIVGVRVAADH